MTTFHSRTLALLQRAGLAPEELAWVGHAARHQVPQEPLGFGLLGPTGVGKSIMLAQMMARHVDRAVLAQPDPDRATLLWIDEAANVARDQRMLWVPWQVKADEIQARRFEDVWIDRWAEGACEIPILVLDDIGREQVDGPRCPARRVFTRVIEYRYRHRMVLYWTSNRTADELTDFYGGPLTSRILGRWPDYPVGGQDMRLFPLEDLKRASGGDR